MNFFLSNTRTIREIGFMTPIKVDGVMFAIAKSNEDGIKDIVILSQGVRVKWNFGTVFVPKHNVAWIDEREV